MGRVVASNVPRAEVDHAVARAFDAESSVVVSVRDAGCAESVLADEGSIPGELSPSPALRRIWKRMESESKACAKRGVQTTVRVSFLQLVGSSLHDLLSSSSSPPQLSLRDYDPSKSPHISGADEVTVTSEAEMLECFQHGAKRLASCNKEPARPSHEEHSRPLPPGNSPHAANGGTPVCPPHQPCASPSPECHLIFSFHIHLQGPLAAMPSQQNSAKPKAAKSSGQRRKARGPPQQVDEWIFRSILRCVDICVPLTPPNGSTAEQPTDTAPPGTSSNGASAPLTSPSVLHLQGSHTLAREDTRSDTGTPSATAGPSRLQQQDGSPHAELSLVPAIMSPFAAAPQSASPLAPRPEWSKPASPTAPADGHRQAADSQDDLIDTATHSTQHASAHEKLGADGEASGPDSTRKRTREAFVFKAHAHAEGTTAAGQGAAQRPHHEVSTFVGLQTAARRLRTSPSTRSPVIMSLVTGAAARAPSLTLPALDGATAGEERSAAQPVSGVQALEGVLRARQEQKAMLPFRAHLLTRILRPSISGTAHCVTLAEPRRLEAEPAETGEEFKARHRAAVLRAFLAALQAHSPRRDTARLDLQSDVVKWMQLENRSLKGELKTAREKVTMLQGFVASRGANEVKTWELWKELETKRASASELQEEVDALLAALHTARSTAEAAEAAASAAGDRAAIEAGMRADVQREAASEAARAAAMEAAADQMARQLATRSTAEHSTAMAAAAAAKAHQVEEPASAEGGAGLHDARPEVSVGLSVANGAVQMRMSVRNSGRAHAAQCHDVSSLRAVESSVDAIASRMGGPGASNGVDAAQPLAGTAQVGDLPDAVLAVRSTLTASLAAAAQQHELRCEQAWRAASGCNDGAVADSTVLGLLTLLARALAPLAAAPSLASGSQPPLSGAGGVTPSASACSLDASLATQQLPSPRTPPYGAARSQAMSRELSPSRTESTSCTPVSASLTGDHPRTNFSTGAPPFDTLPSHVHIHPAGPQQLRAAEVSASQRAAGLAAYPSSSTLHQQGGGASPSEYQGAHWHEDSGAACELFGAVRTAWPADAASTPAEWVTALLGVLQLPRTIDAHIHSLDAKGEAGSVEAQHLILQQQQAASVLTALLPPWDAPTTRTLYVLWGWLLPSFDPPSAPHDPAHCCTPADTSAAECDVASAARKSQPQHSEDAGLAGSTQVHSVCTQSLGAAVHAGGAGDSERVERWRSLATSLHEVVCGLGRQGEKTARRQREERESKAQLLQDCIQAYQVSDREHVQLHRDAAQQAARMRAKCEDAAACARVFDETVENLVAAKMAHATADAALHAMRDQVEALSAQVPLSAGQSTQHDLDTGREKRLTSMLGWGWGSSSSGQVSQGGEAPPSARPEGRLPSAVSRSAAMAKGALSGLSSYFSLKSTPSIRPPDRQALPEG